MTNFNETILWIGAILISVGFGAHGIILGHHLGEMREGSGYRHEHTKIEVFVIIFGWALVITGIIVMAFSKN